VTAPGPDPGTLARLRVVAAWDAALVQGGTGTLRDVLDRLPAWRVRLDALAWALGAAECWSGPAADAAAGTVADLSSVAAAVEAAFGRSQQGWDALSLHAGAAQMLAAQALAVTALADVPAGGWPLPGASTPLLASTMAEEALARAAAAGAAARSAADALTGLIGLGWGASPPTVPDLLERFCPPGAPAGPAGLLPREAAEWWATLSPAAREAVVAAAPAAIGSLDGVPAWARDRANRLLLERALADPSLPPEAARTARVVAARIQAEESAGRTVQLHLLDLAGDRVVLSLGDLDTADAVAVLVPGVFTTPADDLGAQVGDAQAVAAVSRAQMPGLMVATVVWLGYRTPQSPLAMANRSAAQRGGTALAATLDGLSAARAAAGGPLPRTTVLAHSYGTVVVDEAADLPGRLAADAVVLLGSPGMEDDAASLEVPEVYDAAAANDPVAALGWFGVPTGFDLYGSAGLETHPGMGHSDYYDAEAPTLAAVGEVVAGERAPD
jgi:hypothetical protein